MSGPEEARAEVLAAFGVTEADLAVLEAVSGWGAAREAAERERVETWASIQEHARVVEKRLGGSPSAG